MPNTKNKHIKDFGQILGFTHEMHKIKNLLRFKGMPGWEGEQIERWDSVAEHSYRTALLAVLLAPYLSEKVELERVLKIILAHDIVEIIAEDYSPIASHGGGGGHAFDPKAFEEKYRRETLAAEEIFKKLPPELYREFISLFAEYVGAKVDREHSTAEGRFAYALDKLEATIQIIDWRRNSKNWEKDNFDKMILYMHKWADYDESLKEFADLVEKEARTLVAK